MKLVLLLVLPFAATAQDAPSPANVELFRDQLTRISYTPPAGTIDDAAARTREVLRLPLNASPNVPLAELQSAQTALIRLNDIMLAESARTAAVRLLPLLVLPSYRVAPPALKATESRTQTLPRR